MVPLPETPQIKSEALSIDPDLPAGTIREETLRCGLAVPGELQMTAWRGRSRQRHVFILFSASEPDLDDERSGVALAVRRAADGSSHLLDVVVIEEAGIFPLWLIAMRVHGANEIHLHRSATPAENMEIAPDLAPRIALQSDALPQAA